MDFRALLEELRERPDYAGQLLHVRSAPARTARYAELSSPLRPAVRALLERLGLSRFYTHQAAAIDAARSGEHVTVVSGTASGKTLTYFVPLAEALATQPSSRALLLYPTKALAQDQLRKLRDFGAGNLFLADTYDGDTPQSRRRAIKHEAQVVLSNPDMLHLGILPYHHTWASFFRNLRYVVLDEVHTYRGLFGSHTANVLRRLRRLARHYGSEPQFICCSATIGNPAELAEALTGVPTRLVDDDGSPAGQRLFAFWNPPVVDKLTGQRRSGNLEAAALMAALVRRDVRHITFTLARAQAELILRYARDRLAEEGLQDKVMAYRGGYLPKERREIERRLFSGDLLAVTATTALELGVDIGGLEAVILTGYPGSIASTWQQAGRAGRGGEEALAVLVGLSGAVHQYVVNNPDYLLGGRSERAVIDPHNPFIRGAHLLCAAYELPVEDHDRAYFGEDMESLLQILAEGGYLLRRQKWYWLDPDLYPAAEVSIRSASGSAYSIVDATSGALLGTMDAASAFRMIHPGAIYLHGGQTFQVQELDLEARVAKVETIEADYYTRAMVLSEVRRGEVVEGRALGPEVALQLTTVEVRSQVAGFQKLRQVTEQQLDSEPLTLPPEQYETMGVWLLPTADALHPDPSVALDVAGSLHALEHVLITLLPLFVACEPHDVGGVSSPLHPDLSGPGICLYDGCPGGVGLAQGILQRIEELLAAAVERISTCPCSDGCPGCVQQPACGSMNRPLSKSGALALAEHWLRNRGRPDGR